MEAESEAGSKQQLVDCIRMLEQSDIIDYNGHASVRVGDNRMLKGTEMAQRRIWSTRPKNSAFGKCAVARYTISTSAMASRHA